MKDADDKTPTERLEDFAQHIFSMTKDEVEKVEREVEDLATDLAKPEEREAEPD
jgi:hypothetical protein